MIQWNKSMASLAYKIREEHFQVKNPTCGLCGDQVVHRADQMPLGIDIIVSNVIAPDIKEKEGNLQLVRKRRTGR